MFFLFVFFYMKHEYTKHEYDLSLANLNIQVEEDMKENSVLLTV